MLLSPWGSALSSLDIKIPACYSNQAINPMFNEVSSLMKNKNILVLFGLMMVLMLSVFAAVYHKSGKLPVKVVGLVAFTCLPPVGMLFITSRKK